MKELDAMLCSMEITSKVKHPNSFTTCHSEVIGLINVKMTENLSPSTVNSNVQVDQTNADDKKNQSSRRLSKSKRSSTCSSRPSLNNRVCDSAEGKTSTNDEIIDLTEYEKVIDLKYITTRRCSGRHKLPMHTSICDDSIIEVEDEQELLETDLSVLTTNDNVSEAAEKDSPVEVKRSLRKRLHPLEKKVDTQPKIRKLTVEQYYCDKKVKRLPSTLETIYEEPKEQNNEEQLFSTRKFKRVLSFHQDVTMGSKLKSRKRVNKAKKLPFSKKFLNRKKIPLATVMRKLSGTDSDKE